MLTGLKKGMATGLGGIIALAMVMGHTGVTSANTVVPDNQKASITVQGSGVSPRTKITLSTGPKQSLVTESDQSGNFAFSNLVYASFTTLKFDLDIPPNNEGLAKNAAGSHLQLTYDPRGSKARISGTIGKSGTVAFNLAGADASLMQVAGEEGYVNLQTRTDVPLASGASKLVASIINVGETCCPRMIVPATPITLTISSLPLSTDQPVAPRPAAPASVPYMPYNHPAPPVPVPNIVKPVPKTAPQEAPANKPAKKKIPYIVQGKIDMETTITSSPDFAAAVSFSSSDYDRTYVGGLKKLADEIRNAMIFHVAAFGTMIDGRNFMDALRSIQVSTVETMKNYTPSESICRFGTLSRSLTISEATVDKNRLAFSKVLFDRNNQKRGTLYDEPGVGKFALIEDFKKKYCEFVDNSGFLKGYCAVATATSDLLYNRDVDFTRVFDVPLTLDADFTRTTKTNDQGSLIALFHSLSEAPPYMTDEGEESFDPNKNLITTQDARAINAAREVANNTFGALVAEKVKSPVDPDNNNSLTPPASTTYMKAVLTQLGVSATDATKLIGDNPSYFAQMEIMTKKIFQDPAFYANLYDSPANIDRQRVAMKAVELQQGRDFLESLRRREMLLSVLLNLKLKTDANRANEAGTIGGGAD